MARLHGEDKWKGCLGSVEAVFGGLVRSLRYVAVLGGCLGILNSEAVLSGEAVLKGLMA